MEEEIKEACMKGDVDSLTSMINGKSISEISQVYEGGKTLLHLTAKGESASCLKCMEILINKGADIECKYDKGDAPLHLVCGSDTGVGHLDRVVYLLKVGAKIEAVDNDGSTSLMYACLRGHC